MDLWELGQHVGSEFGPIVQCKLQDFSALYSSLQLLRSFTGNQLTLVDYRNSLGETFSLVHHVRSDNNGRTLVPQLPDHLPDQQSARDVEEGRGFVEDRYARPLNHNLCVLHFLLHTSAHQPCPLLA